MGGRGGMCVCVCVINVCRMGRKQERLPAVPFPGVIFPAATLPRPLCEGAKKYKIAIVLSQGE